MKWKGKEKDLEHFAVPFSEQRWGNWVLESEVEADQRFSAAEEDLQVLENKAGQS